MEAFFFSIFVEHAAQLSPVPQLRRFRAGRGSWAALAAAWLVQWWPSAANPQ